jgi:hypothetical protein
MSEHGEPAGQLQLVGYEKVTDHGLALPIFGRSRGANVYYTARSSSPSDANGQIAGFDAYDPDKLVLLSLEQIRETSVGNPWLDIFLWKGVVYVGTAAEIWNALAEVRASITEKAPLSLLTLAEGVDRVPDIELVRKAFDWLARRHGVRKAFQWRSDTFLRGLALKGLRRQLGASARRTDIRRALQEKLRVHQDGNRIIVSVDPPLPPNPFRALDAFFIISSGLGLNPMLASESRESTTSRERIVGNRTSEDAMRIAALRVAGSRPNGKATTSELKNEVIQYLTLSQEDLLPSKTRPNEAMYQQIVGNIVSHRGSRNNIFVKGWALYTGDGIQITDAGRQYLRTLGVQS